MKILRTLLLIACTVAVCGCVTWSGYSNPYEPGRGQYTGAADAYSHDAGAAVVDVSIADVAYYPWWSVDYYYLGGHHYRPAYLRGPYFSLGYTFGYPAGYWPYYGFFSPFYYPYASYAWYDPWTGFPRYGIGLDFPWLDVYWARRFRDYMSDHHEPGYVYGSRRLGYPLSREEVLTDARDRAYPGDGLLRREAQPLSREVWTAPSTSETDALMEVRSRRERKIEESHIGPAPVPSGSAPGPSARVISAPPSASVAPAPGIARELQPSQPSLAAPRRQANPPAAASPPPISRQMQAPPRSAPSMPAPIRGPSGSGAPPTPKGDDGQHKQRP